MARLPRLTVPGQPHHVIQRGNNQQAIFLRTADYQAMLGLLTENAARFEVRVHAYVMMETHFHLLVTPDTPRSIAQMMQSVGRQYVRYFNDTHHRSGTLWEGRYKSAVLQADRYLLPCMVYIDLLPVRAALVSQAEDYPWSSHGHYAGRRADPLISTHPLVWELGNTPFAREAGYSRMVQVGIAAQVEIVLAAAAMSGWALGEPDYLAALQKLTPRRLSKLRPGRRVREKQVGPGASP